MRKLQLLFLAFLSFAFQGAFADTNIGDGTGSSEKCPLYAYYEYSFAQSVYPAGQLGNGMLSGIKIYHKGGGSPWTFSNVKVILKEVPDLTVPYTRITDGTTVYSGSFSMDAAEGWKEIIFDDPYLYTGFENLIVLIQQSTNDYVFPSYSVWGFHPAPPNSTCSDYGIFNLPTTGDYTAQRMDMTFMGLEFTIPGTISGLVTNGQGAALSNAVITMNGLNQALTGADGTYSIDEAPSGVELEIGCMRAGYAPEIVSGVLLSNAEDRIIDFVLKAPDPIISPTSFYEMMQPNEYRKKSLGVTNNGDGLFDWFAELEFLESPSRIKKFSKKPNRIHIPRTLNPSAGAVDNSQTATSQEVETPINAKDYFREYPIYAYNNQTSQFGWFDNETPGVFNDMGAIPQPGFFNAGDFPVGTEEYLYTFDSGGDCFRINLEDGVATPTFLGNVGVSNIAGMATDPTSGLMYVISTTDLYLFDEEEISLELIGPFNVGSQYMIAAAIDGEGVLYTYDIDNNRLYSIDKQTGTGTVIGDLGFDPNYGQGMAYDPVSEQVFMTAYNVSSGAPEYRIVDTQTGSSALIGALTGQTAYCAMPYGNTSNWLWLDDYSGVVDPNGGIENIGVNFNAFGRVPGEILKANIHLRSAESIGLHYTIPVTMEIVGDELPFIEELTAILQDPVEGVVRLDWMVPEGMDFDHFLIYRNNDPIGTTTNNYYQDDLAEYGVYHYAVATVMSDGTMTTPIGPAEIIWLIPSPCELDLDLEQEVWVDHFEYVYTNIKNCGEGVLEFEFTEFLDGGTVGFIVDVMPVSGDILPGQEATIRFKYDATDKTPGEYTAATVVATNALNPDDEFEFNHKMMVVTPSSIIGTVRDGNTNARLAGVEVKAVSATDTFMALTDDNGEYLIYCDDDEYDLTFTKIGYQTEMTVDVDSDATNPPVEDMLMYEMAYAPGMVRATVNLDAPEDTHCLVEWTLPQGPYELLYDDGDIDNYIMGLNDQAKAAVVFTPKGYPAVITGARVNVGDGSFPVNGNFIGSQVKVGIYFPDPATDNEFPLATPEDEKIFTVDNYGWVNFLDKFAVVINEGNFFVVISQMGEPMTSAPIGVDEAYPIAYASYAYSAQSGWTVSPMQDLMIRAIVAGPTDQDLMAAATQEAKQVNIPKPLGGEILYANAPKGISGIAKTAMALPRADLAQNRDVLNYTVARIDIEDPLKDWTEDPSVVLATSLNALQFDDLAWAGITPGWYGYKVKSHYTNGDESPWAYSNTVAHKIYSKVTVNVQLTTELIADNCEVLLTGLIYPYATYFHSTDDNALIGVAEFPADEPQQDWFYYGNYNLEVFKIGYHKYVPENYFEIYQPTFVINVMLEEKKYQVRDLYVDPLTSIATWSDPLITELWEDFEGEEFPPEDWQSFTLADAGNYQGWFHANNDNATYSSFFVVPERDGWWAEASDDAAGSMSDGSMDYLITRECDLRESDTFEMIFESFYTGGYGQLAFVEYTLDEGDTWVVLGQLDPAADWTTVSMDLGDLDGIDGEKSIRFAFHADDAGGYATGWAVDDVRITNGASSWKSFHVFLDDAFQGETDLYTWWYPNLIYGQTYTASVAAEYTSGLSVKDYYTFVSEWLVPPYNFEGSTYDKQVVLNWDSPRFWEGTSMDDGGPTGAIPNNLMGFNIYRNDVEEPYAFVERNDMYDPYSWTDDAEPGIYDYYITAVYDLTEYGYPTERAESMMRGPINIDLSWGYELPFFEDWSAKNFEDQNWNAEGNWTIDDFNGIDAPSAKFNFDPIASDYKMSITTAPINAVGMEMGDIYLDFQYKHNMINATAEEQLLVQIGSGDTYQTVATFKNTENVDWSETVHLKVTSKVMNKVVHVRFVAKGATTNDIRAWYVDNIHLYRECPEVTDLKTTVYHVGLPENNDKNGIELSWIFDNSGGNTSDEWVYHETLEQQEVLNFGTTSGTFYFANKFSPAQLEAFVGSTFDKVRGVFGSGVSTLKVELWIGDSDNVTEKIHEQNIATNTILVDEMTEWNLESMISIEAETYYYVVFVANCNANEPIIGIDAGPSVVGEGDLLGVTIDQLAPAGGLLGAGFDSNWRTGIHIGGGENLNRTDWTYEIYRKCEINNAVIEELSMIATTSDLIYWDDQEIPEGNLVWDMERVYTYKVLAKGTADADACESLGLVSKPNNYFYVGIEEQSLSNLKLYPNPSDAKVTIENANAIIERIQVMNNLGQLILAKDVNSNTCDIDLGGQPAGIYMIKIEQEDQVIVRKLTLR